MKELFILGKSLSHSFSPQFFNQKFIELGIEKKYIYTIHEIDEIEDVKKINLENCIGFNVTIPYKVEIIPYLNYIENDANEIGAVNCVKVDVINDALYLTGYNTDYIGFIKSIQPELKPYHRSALIFGNGGATKAIIYGLKKLGIDYQVVSRTGSLNYTNITTELIKNTDILINTTPLGMYPNVNECISIPYSSIRSEQLAFDLIYNPSKTLFLQKAESNGAKIINGLNMLQIQAEENWRIWNE